MADLPSTIASTTSSTRWSRAATQPALRDPELAPPLMAADLRHYPNATTALKARARTEDHDDRRSRPMPDLFRPDTPYGKDSTTVTPYIWVPDRGLADFLIRVFDAVETNVMDNPGHGIIENCGLATDGDAR